MSLIRFCRISRSRELTFVILTFFLASFFYLTYSKRILLRANPIFPDKSVKVLTSTCFDNVSGDSIDPQVNVIYVVTPTYSRREQTAEMTRLGQTLLHVKNLIWIVAEDSKTCSKPVQKILK